MAGVRDLGVHRACLCAAWVNYIDLVSLTHAPPTQYDATAYGGLWWPMVAYGAHTAITLT